MSEMGGVLGRLKSIDTLYYRNKTVKGRAKIKLQEAVWINIDTDPDPARKFEASQPCAHDVLQLDRALGVDQQPLPVASSQHGERGRGGAIYMHAFDFRGGASHRARRLNCFAFIFGADDDRGKAPKGWRTRAAALLGFRVVKSVPISIDKCRDYRMRWIACLDVDLTRFFSTPGTACRLGNLLECPFGSTQVAAFKAEVGIDDANQREFGEMISLGDQLRADDDVYGFVLNQGDKFGSFFRGP